jgi:L-aspartate oxidase
MQNRLVTARLIATAALRREESRGAHFRSDFPEAKLEFAHRSFLTLERAEAEGRRAAELAVLEPDLVG